MLRRLNLGMPAQEQLYRRMVFNVVMRNHDDHTKNFSFLMDRQGKWTLAPAYDLCYAYSPEGRWTSRHQLSLNGKQADFTREDLLQVAENMGISKSAAMIDRTVEVASRWMEYAHTAGVPEPLAGLIDKNLIML